MLTIIQALEEQHLAQVRGLMYDFVTWLRQHYADKLDLINEYFDPQDFSQELSSLPGKYAMPEGQLLLALQEQQPVGCVGLRKLDTQNCEMKRLFVSTEFQGQGIGHALVKELIQGARTQGYTTMRLDTGIHQTQARKLYQSFGFKQIQPYYEVPKSLQEGLVFMELRL